jgi:hypothetical protein
MKGMFKRQVTCLETQNVQTAYEKGALHFRIFAWKEILSISQYMSLLFRIKSCFYLNFVLETRVVI